MNKIKLLLSHYLVLLHVEWELHLMSWILCVDNLPGSVFKKKLREKTVYIHAYLLYQSAYIVILQDIIYRHDMV